MGISLNTILDWLEPFSPRPGSSYDPAQPPRFTSFFPYAEEDSRPDPAVLWVWSAHGALPAHSGYCYLCAEEPPPGFPGLAVVVSDGCLEPASALLVKRFQAYFNWTVRIYELSRSNAPLQSYLDAGTELLPNPLLAFDASCTLLAASKNAQGSDYPHFAFRQVSNPDPEFMLGRFAHLEYDSETVLPNGDLLRVSTQAFGRPELFYAAQEHGAPRLLINSVISHTKLTQGYIDLYVDFCLLVRNAVSLPSFYATHRLTAYELKQALELGNYEPLRAHFPLAEGERYMVGVLSSQAADAAAQARCLDLLVGTLPRSLSFTYGEVLCFLMCVSDDEAQVTNEAYQLHILSSALELLDLSCGLSYRFTRLPDIPAGIEQGQQALDLAAALDRGGSPWPRLHFYSDVALEHIARCFFPRRSAASFLPPALRALWRDTAENAAAEDPKSFQLIYHYLLSGKSLQKTADALYLHRNTVSYRLNRLKERYGLGFDNDRDNALLLLCCLALQRPDVFFRPEPGPTPRP